MGKHAKFGGSTIARTKNCRGWANFCADIPNISSEWADRGTLLHQAMEWIFKGDVNVDTRQVIGSAYAGIELTEALYVEKIAPAIEAVEDIFDLYDIQDFVCESRVVIDEEKDIWGGADLIARGEVTLEDPPGPGGGQTLRDGDQTLKVGLCLDYKFGDGNIVVAQDNDQGLFYSVAGSLTLETRHFFEGIDLLVIAIVQPNDRGMDDYTIWECDAAVLDQEHRTILKVCEISEKADPTDPDAFKAGDHCNFCRGDGLCPPTSGAVAAMRRLDVTAPDLIQKIPPYKELKRTAKTIEKLLAFVYKQLNEGVEIPGFKLVPKQARRSYTDLVAAEAVAKKSKKLKQEEVYKMEFHSPTQIEKLLKAKLAALSPDQRKKMIKSKRLDFEALFGSLVQKISSGTTLAGEDDPREANPGMGALQALLDRD